MKPHVMKLPFTKPLHNLHNIPKLLIFSSLILLFINIFSPLYNIPLLSSSSSSLSPYSPPLSPPIISISAVSSSSSASPIQSRPHIDIQISSSSSSSSFSVVAIDSSSSSSAVATPAASPSPYSFTPTISPSPPAPPPPPSHITNPEASSSSTATTNFSPPSPSLNLNSKKKITRLGKKCDISKGEWVRDREAPYYTNTTCWTIQEHQNCMKYGRPDVDFLKWRWKPRGCELLRFDPARFLELVRGKSMAFVGDSLARNQMQSLMCLLSRVEYPEDVSDTKDENFKRMFYTNYNFTIYIFWSPFLVKAEAANTNGPSRSTLWNLYLDEPDKKWVSRIDRFDYIVISGGNWFNRPSMFYKKGRVVGCLYCDLPNVTPLTMHYSHRMAFRTVLRAINRRAGFRGMTILRALSPAHFENGVWDKGGDCVRTRPFRSNETRLEETEQELYKAQSEEFRKAERVGRKRGRAFRMLDTTGAMLLRPDGHPSRYGHWPDETVTMYNDCVHWCLPGPIDSWNDFLLHSLS